MTTEELKHVDISLIRILLWVWFSAQFVRVRPLFAISPPSISIEAQHSSFMQLDELADYQFMRSWPVHRPLLDLSAGQDKNPEGSDFLSFANSLPLTMNVLYLSSDQH